MILECPSCHARFSVADHMIPATGRTVRCSKCAHAWHVEGVALQANIEEPKPYTPSPEVAAAVAAGEAASIATPPKAETRPRTNTRPARRANDPKPMSATPFKIAVPLIAACWFALAFITYSPSWSQGMLSGIYKSFGVTPTDGLVFADVSLKTEKEGVKTRFIFKGEIRNNASADRMIPTVRIMLKDKKGNTIRGWEYPVHEVLKPGKAYPFSTPNVETAMTSSVANIVVDMGNSMQLLLR